MSIEGARLVVFLAFANDRNDRTRYLRNLHEECGLIRNALKDAETEGLCELVVRENVGTDEILNIFQDKQYNGRIAIFHYAGHADDYRLLTESPEGRREVAYADGLAGFIGQQASLQLVFLNACSTGPQVSALLDARVSAVVATSQSVPDEMALDFAERFYNQLGLGGTIRRSYEVARQAVMVKHGAQTRDLGVPSSDLPAEQCLWELHTRPDETDALAAWNLRAAAADLTFGLPRLPEVDLPSEGPFRYLEYFNAAQAELFFGRGSQIRQLYDWVTGEGNPPIIFLYGQSGVGKSSLLDAGLIPRISSTYEVRYRRFDSKTGLNMMLRDALGDRDASRTFGESWLSAEAQIGRPLLLILDQLEEALISRESALANPFATFVESLRATFQDESRRPKGKLILGFRKEWLAEFEKHFADAKIPRQRMFLEPLDRDGIIEAILGPGKLWIDAPESRFDRRPFSRRLFDRYGLLVDKGLPEEIADDLLADRESPVAPTLQILLSKMWEKAKERDAAHPRFDQELYHELKKKGLHLSDFLDQQFEVLRAWKEHVVRSGLVLDLLNFHTTPLGTATTRSGEDLFQTYGQIDFTELASLLNLCKRHYLLVDPSGQDNGREIVQSRLAHDTLAPLILERYAKSTLPGQRARRLLDNRAGGWECDPTADSARIAHGAEAIADDTKPGRQRGFPWRSPRWRLGLEWLAGHSWGDRFRSNGKAFDSSKFAGVEQDTPGTSHSIVVELSTLDGPDLADVERGKMGTRNWTDAERNLVKASRRERVRRKRTWQSIIAVLFVCFFGMLILAIVAVKSERYATKQKLMAENSERDAKTSKIQAEKNALEAEKNAVEANRKTIELLTIDGNNSIDRGSPFKAMHSFARAVGRDEPGRDENRIRLGALASQQPRLISVLEHAGAINAARFSGDGSLVVTASSDQKAKVWDAKTGDLVYSFKIDTDGGGISSAAFSPDGTRVLTGATDWTVRVWDVKRQIQLNPETQLGAGQTYVWSVAWSPDDMTYLSASEDGSLAIWHAESCFPLQSFQLHKPVRLVACAQDGKRFLTVSDETGVIVWNVERVRARVSKYLADHVRERLVLPIVDDLGDLIQKKDDRIKILDDQDKSVRVMSAAFSGDSTRIVTARHDSTARVYDATAKVPQVLRVLDGHAGPVNSAAFSPDGKLIVTASDDFTARVYDTASGVTLRVLEGHAGSVRSAVFNPDGTQILTASDDTTSRVYDARTGITLAELAGHQSAVSSAAFNPDGTQILTASSDGTARLWDVPAVHTPEKNARRVDAHTFSVISPDGSLALNISGNESPRIHDFRTDKPDIPLPGHDAPVHFAAFSPDGRHVVTASDDRMVRVFHADTGELERNLGELPIPLHSAAFSPDGRYVVTLPNDETARVWDLTTTNKSLELRTRRRGLTLSVQYSPNRRRWLVVPTDQMRVEVHEIDDKNREDVFFLNHEQKKAVFYAALSPDGENVVTGAADGTASLWQARLWQRKEPKPLHNLTSHETSIRFANFSHDGRLVATASEDGDVVVSEVQSGKWVATLSGHNAQVNAIDFTSNRERAVTCSDDATARVWEVRTGKLLAVLSGHRGPIYHAAFNPAGRQVVTISADRTVRIWDASTGNRLPGETKDWDPNQKKFQATPDWIHVLRSIEKTDNGQTIDEITTDPWGARTFSETAERFTEAIFPARSSDRLLTRTDAGRVQVWELEPGPGLMGPSLKSLRICRGDAKSASFNPDGTRVVIGRNDFVEVWVPSMRKGSLTQIEGHGGSAGLVAFDPDGKSILAATNRIVRLWKSDATGQFVSDSDLVGHTERVTSAAFSRDGGRLVTASDDGTARVWDTKTHQLLAVLEGHTGPISSAAIVPDGSRVLTASKSDGFVMIRNLRPLREEDAPIVSDWVEAYTGTRMVDTVLQGLSREKLEAVRQELGDRYESLRREIQGMCVILPTP